jgi:hypothetical protein
MRTSNIRRRNIMSMRCAIRAALAAACLLAAAVLPGAADERFPNLAREMGSIRGVNYMLRSGWSHYDPKQVRADLAVAKALGFNSVRTFLSFGDYKADPARFQANMADYLTACRENSLTAMPAINPDRASFKGLGEKWRKDPAVLYKDDFLPYRYLKMFMTEFDRPFADVVICWDLWNEPFWDAMIADDDMDITRAGVVWFSRTAEHFKPVNPTTIGWALLEDLLEDPELCDLTTVVSFHFYNPTLTGYIKKYKIARELFKAHGNRPFIMSELGRPGMLQPYSDPAAFCESENVGYYMWEVFAHGGWQRIQGVVWEDAGLRASTLPKWIVDGYKKRSDLFIEGYDVTAAGADVLAGALDRALAAFADRAASPAAFYDALEYLYNARRAADPGWTPDLRDVYPPFEAKTPRDTIRKAFRETLDKLRPLVRTDGNRPNDNALGGETKIAYEDVWSRTGRIENIWETAIPKFVRLFVTLNPTFYQKGYGKGGGQAAGNITTERVLLQGWRYDPDKAYLFEADVRPPQASAEVGKLARGGAWAGLAVDVRPGIERDCGILAGVTLSGPGGGGTVFVDRFPPTNVISVVRLFEAALKKEDFDAAGYVHLGIRFQGDADLRGAVLVNGRELKTFAAKEILGRGDRLLALEGSLPPWRRTGLDARYAFDNLKVTDFSANRAVLSDSFERSGKNGERLSYVVDTAALEKMAALDKVLQGKGK